jgi:hypothetical protein
MTELGAFHTPSSWKELNDWIDLHPREDRIHLIVVAAMGFNLAVKQSKEETSND